MKKLTILTGMMLLSVALFSQLTWYPQNSGTNNFLSDIYFTDHLNGWTCGQAGSMFRTNDGGATWTELDPLPNNIYFSLSFSDPLNGWASGFGGTVIHTTDGGDTWEYQETGSETYLYGIQFMDENTGWAIGGDNGVFPSLIPHREILHTTDGGDTWITQLYESDVPLLRALHFVDGNVGYAVGESGTVLGTTDGGQSWTELMYDQSYHFNSVHFVNADKGFITAEYLGLPHAAVIFMTEDGGQTWTNQQFGENDGFSDVFFSDEDHGWVVGGQSGQSLLLYTEDGGSTWNYGNAGTDHYLSAVFFTDNVTGWAAGESGTIISTSTVTGVEDNSAALERLTVYPNPATDRITIKTSTPEQADLVIRIFNTTGQELYRVEDTYREINIGNLIPGIYMIIADHDGKREFSKLVVR